MTHFLDNKNALLAVITLQLYALQIYFYKYFLKKDKTKLKAFLTSRSTFFSFKSPRMVQPCFMSGNSTISNASPRICLLNPSFLTVSESFSEGKYNCGHLMSFKQVFSSSPRIALRKAKMVHYVSKRLPWLISCVTFQWIVPNIKFLSLIFRTIIDKLRDISVNCSEHSVVKYKPKTEGWLGCIETAALMSTSSDILKTA